jgi:hypothetical protein
MDQRQRPRISLPQAITGEVTVYRSVSVSELSLEGARLETPEPLRVNSIRAVRLSLGDQPLVVKARVCHASVRALHDDVVVYTSGVEFLDLTPAARLAIEGYLKRVGSIVTAEYDELG